MFENLTDRLGSSLKSLAGQGALTEDNIRKIVETYQNGESVDKYAYVASLDEIKREDFVLTPGRYVGAQGQEEDDEPFAEKMARLTMHLREQFAQSNRLEAEIKRNLGGLGYEC